MFSSVMPFLQSSLLDGAWLAQHSRAICSCSSVGGYFRKTIIYSLIVIQKLSSWLRRLSLQFIVEVTLLSLIVIILNSNRSVFHYFLKIQFTTFKWTPLQMRDFLISVEFGLGRTFFGILRVKILWKSLSGALPLFLTLVLFMICCCLSLPV